MPIATSTAIALGMGAAGVGASVYGANKAAKAQQHAVDANRAAVDETNRLNYARWLETQGVGANGQPINTWLPRHMSMNANAVQPRRFRRAGAVPVPNTTVAPQSPAATGGFQP